MEIHYISGVAKILTSYAEGYISESKQLMHCYQLETSKILVVQQRNLSLWNSDGC